MTEKYLLLIVEDPAIFDDWSKERWAQHDERHREFTDAVNAAGREGAGERAARRRGRAVPSG